MSKGFRLTGFVLVAFLGLGGCSGLRSSQVQVEEPVVQAEVSNYPPIEESGPQFTESVSTATQEVSQGIRFLMEQWETAIQAKDREMLASLYSNRKDAMDWWGLFDGAPSAMYEAELVPISQNGDDWALFRATIILQNDPTLRWDKELAWVFDKTSEGLKVASQVVGPIQSSAMLPSISG